MLVSIMPMARTPMDKKAGSAMRSYTKKLERAIRDMTPWRRPMIGLGLRGRIAEGEMVVVLDSDESSDDPLYRGAKIIRE